MQSKICYRLLVILLIPIYVSCNNTGGESPDGKDSSGTSSALGNDTIKSAASDTSRPASAASEAAPPDNIQMVVSTRYVPPVVTSTATRADAIRVILDEFNRWAAIQCSNRINESLGKKWEDTKTRYAGKFPAGSSVLFLVLVDKPNCNVVGMVPESQTVRVKENVCSVNDIKVDRPDLIYDPTTTGFFTVKVKF